MRSVAFAVLIFVLGVASAARADESTDAEARQHYKAATGHFAVGEFAQAASEYEAAFKLHQDAALLFNAAQSRRLAGENQKALVLYKNYLQLYPNTKNAPAVREQIGKVQEAIAADEKAKTSPPTNTVEAHGVGEPATQQQQQQQATPPPPAATETAQANATPPSDQPRPVYKKWWFWTIIGAVVVVAVVIPVAIVASQGDWNNLPDQGPGAKASRVSPSPMLEVRW